MTKVTINAQNIQNCSIQIKDGYNREVAYTWAEDRKTISTDMNVGGSYSFRITANDGYKFSYSTIPTIKLGSNNMSFTIQNDHKTATFYGVNSQTYPISYENITITAKPEELPKPITVTENLEHCTSNITGQSLIKGESYDIVLTADTGYYFNNAPTINEGGYIYEFNLSSDSHSAALSRYVVMADIVITATAVSESGENDDYTFFRMYSPDDKYLSEFADNIVYQIGGEGFNEYDLTPYIYALYVLPFKLSTLVELKNVPGIEFNKYTYKNEVPSILNSDRIFTIDFGELNFERQFNSDFDFDCSIRLDVPFFDSIVLNPYDVIGRSVHVVGYVNLFNRTMDLTVTGENGDIIAEQKRQIGYSIPYLSQSYKTASTYSDEMSNSLAGIQAIETYDFEIKQVSDLSGYVKADFVEPEEADFIGEDWDNIRAILESGVIYG